MSSASLWSLFCWVQIESPLWWRPQKCNLYFRVNICLCFVLLILSPFLEKGLFSPLLFLAFYPYVCSFELLPSWLPGCYTSTLTLPSVTCMFPLVSWPLSLMGSGFGEDLSFVYAGLSHRRYCGPVETQLLEKDSELEVCPLSLMWSHCNLPLGFSILTHDGPCSKAR